MKQFSFRSIARAIRWHRRGAALFAIVVAVFAGLGAVTSAHTTGAPLVVAATDLSPGVVLQATDLSVVDAPPELVPSGSFTNPVDLVGRPLSVGLTQGTAITTAALTDAGLVDHTAAEVLVPIRVHDADVATLLRVGDRLTIVSSTPEGIVATVAEHIRVAQLPRAASGGLLSGGSTTGALIVVAVPQAAAARVAASSDQWLGVIIE